MQYLKLVQKEEELIDPKLDAPAVYLAEETGKLAYFKGNLYKIVLLYDNGDGTYKFAYTKDIDMENTSDFAVDLLPDYKDNTQCIIITNKSKLPSFNPFYVTINYEGILRYVKCEKDGYDSNEKIDDNMCNYIPEFKPFIGKYYYGFGIYDSKPE